jgi:polysaccharide deacetylase family sporulation protein PdaB
MNAKLTFDETPQKHALSVFRIIVLSLYLLMMVMILIFSWPGTSQPQALVRQDQGSIIEQTANFKDSGKVDKAGPPGLQISVSTLAVSTNINAEYYKGVFTANPRASKKIALTFDDGPHPVWTEKYLHTLETFQVPATFFLVGSRIEKYPHLAAMIVKQGHEVGNHAYSHCPMDLLQGKQQKKELELTTRLLMKTTGKTVYLFRPPYGRYDDNLIAAASEINQYVITWNNDPKDWQNPGAHEIVNRVMKQVKGGSIILLHEGKKNTWEALPLLIQQLRSQGYELVTVSSLNDLNIMNIQEYN